MGFTAKPIFYKMIDLFISLGYYNKGTNIILFSNVSNTDSEAKDTVTINLI